MKKTVDIREDYFMDDPREAERLERKVNAQAFVAKYLKKHIDQLSQAKILEAGCGPGVFLQVLGSKYVNHTITGIDISADRVEQANKRLFGLNNAMAILADIYHLPFPDNHFDFIYCRFLYEYLHSPIIATKELYRVCKPGGKILIQDLDGQFTFYPELSLKFKNVLTTVKQRTGFDPDIGRKLFSFGKAAGFLLIDINTEMYHNVFGKIDDHNYDLWNLKLEIAFGNLKGMLGENAEKLKVEILESLKDEKSVMFSTLFTIIFEKSLTRM